MGVKLGSQTGREVRTLSLPGNKAQKKVYELNRQETSERRMQEFISLGVL
jgi:hypothetical protein